MVINAEIAESKATQNIPVRPLEGSFSFEFLEESFLIKVIFGTIVIKL